MKYFLIAGEASGDLHAGRLIEAIRKNDDNASFAFFGGDCMEHAAGCRPITHYKEMALWRSPRCCAICQQSSAT